MMHTQWPLLWLATNGLTGLAYLLIALVVLRERQVRAVYWLLFASFVAACGAHHLVHIVPVFIGGHPGDSFTPVVLDAAQLFVDMTMTSVSVYTACVVCSDYWRNCRGCHA